MNREDPHALSEVLSGALYRTLVYMHESTWKRYGGEFSRSGFSLMDALRKFQRLVFRAMDLLPPGEVSFVDYVTALDAEERSAWLCEEKVIELLNE